MRRRHPAGLVAMVGVGVAVVTLQSCASPNQVEDDPAVPQPVAVVESYDPCDPDLGNAPCVLAGDPDGLYWFALDARGNLVGIPMNLCVEEDGPAPCILDTKPRGNGTAGPGIARFVMVRD